MIFKKFTHYVKKCAFFHIWSQKKEIKTMSKQITIFNTPMMMKHSEVSIDQQNI